MHRIELDIVLLIKILIPLIPVWSMPVEYVLLSGRQTFGCSELLKITLRVLASLLLWSIIQLLALIVYMM